jgi:hypothetical protein
MHASHKTLRLLASLAALFMTACGGGSGGGGPMVATNPSVTPPTVNPRPPPALTTPLPSSPTAFTRFPISPTPGTVALTGLGRAMSPTGSLLGTGDQTLTLSLDGSGLPAVAWIQVGSQVMSVTSTDGPLRYSTPTAAGSLTLIHLGYPYSILDYLKNVDFVDPALQSWNYQTFGWWAGASDQDPARLAGSFSVGAATPGSAIPTSGSAVFRGQLAAEIYAATVGYPTDVAAPVSLTVDFGARSAALASSDWRDAKAIQAGTALSGLLTYQSQQNLLAGTLTTANGQFSGGASAQFYGPRAEEVGGVFTLAPTNGPGAVVGVVGGFGAAR